MKIVYIDAQNVHKSTIDMGRTIDRKQLYDYLMRKFTVDIVKIFFGYIPTYKQFYESLERIGYVVIFKETMRLPTGEYKGNVDVDITIHSILDMIEGGLGKAYLISGDGDYNTLILLFRERGFLGRVLIPHRDKASKLLKKAAGSDIQVLEDLRYFLEKKNPT